jgi:hypothetical protein
MIVRNESLRAIAVAAAGACIPVVVLADRGDRRTVRLTPENGRPLIAKLWSLGSPRARVRQLLRRTKGRAEWEAGCAMAAAKIPVPVPQGYFRLRDRRTPYHECVLLEHLDDAVSAATALHRAVNTRDDSRSHHITAGVLDITRRCLEAGLIDRDLRLSNFLISGGGAVYRIDFENAVVRRRAPSPAELGRMLGALIATYAWMARPQEGLADSFADDLLSVCGVESAARRLALAHARREINRLQRRTGVSVPFRELDI